MVRRNLYDLLYFIAVAQECSFIRGASLRGSTQSALSQAISGPDGRLDIRLFSRITRSVSLQVTSERWPNAIDHRIDEMAAELYELTAMRDKPDGMVRIKGGEHVLLKILLPKLSLLDA